MKPATLISLILILVVLIAPKAEADSDEASQEQKAVLITGASTGLGRAMAELMASNGHLVYAGARKDKDIAELNAI